MTVINKYDFGGVATEYEVVCDDTRIIHAGTFDHQDSEIVPLVYVHRNNDITQNLGHAILIKSDSPLGMRVKAKFNSSKQGKTGKQLVHSKEFKYLSIWANDVVETRGEDGLLHVTRGQIREVSIVQKGNKNPGAVIDEVIVHSEDNDGFLVLDGLIIHAELEVYEDEVDDNDTIEEESEEVDESEETSEETSDETTEEETTEEADQVGSGEPEGELEGESQVEHASNEEDTEDDTEDDTDEDSETIQDVLSTFSDDQFDFLTYIVSYLSGEDIEATGDDSENGGLTASEILDTFSEKQKNVLYYIVGQLADPEKINIEHGENKNMTRNIFEEGLKNNETGTVISHADFWSGVLQSAADNQVTSLRRHIIAHAGTYGIDNISNLFPDAQSVTGKEPEIYGPRAEWVEKVLGPVQRSPFSKIKSTYADITPDAARAKGYITGTQKVDVVFSVLKRETSPTTVYIRERLDRDDLLDITDFNVVMWMKKIMEVKMREEKARAILYGDGRDIADPLYIDKTKIRPILGDDVLYNTLVTLQDPSPLNWHYVEDPEFDEARVLKLIDDIAEARKHYRGSGAPTLFTSTEIFTKLMLVRDSTGRRIHNTAADLAGAMLVKEIVEVPDLSMYKRTEAGVAEHELVAIIVNMNDYVTGRNRGGEETWFDQFDINYNQYIWLYETRFCGALVTPKTAVTVEVTAEDLS